ncbi:MAG: tail fiber domain-containing protein [Phycisphaeraceae bacterium]|nr:tail fiber domain-containing protein [Phycisphaeraceae bacterium]
MNKLNASFASLAVCVAMAGAAGAPPANDNMANAQWAGPGTLLFDTTEATTDGPTYACESGQVDLGRDIWYRIHTTGAGTVTLATCGSSFDTTIAVYLGLSTANRIACSDQATAGPCPGTNYSYREFVVAANTDYLINVGGYGGVGGPGVLTITGPLESLADYTYQGRITSGGAPVNGTANLTFRMFDSLSGGLQVGSTRAQSNVPVSGGVFSSVVNFDPPGLVKSPLYLQVDVNGQALPRQRITSVPLAAQALVAQQVAWSDITGVPSVVTSGWTKSGSDLLFSTGRVGIGGAPQYPLHVVSSGFPAAQVESANQFGTWFNVNNTSAGGLFWRMISTGSGNGEGAGKLLLGWSTAATSTGTVMTLQNNGNVGIGTTFPAQKLTVNGNVLANNVAVPSSIRFKDHVVPMDDALESLLRIEGVRFDWKPEYAKERGFVSDVGFVAEDVAKVFPEIVFKDADGNVIGMDYSRVTAVAVEAIKQLKLEQEKQIEKLRAEKDGEISELRQRLEKLEKAIEKAK